MAKRAVHKKSGAPRPNEKFNLPTLKTATDRANRANHFLELGGGN